jgi:agmatinase
MDWDRPLTVSSQLVRARGHASAASHARLRSQVEVSAEGWKFLECFRTPATPNDVARSLGVDDGGRAHLEREIEALLANGLLVPPDENEYLYREGHRLAGSFQPATYEPGAGFLGAQAVAGPVDFRVLGVPYGHTSGSPGAARGARAVREASTTMPAYLDARTGVFRGLWDHGQRRLLLEGARLGDAGDVYVEPWASPAEAYDRIERAAREVLKDTDGTPVFLGGDHSVTEPILRALVARAAPVFVVHFDAHTDMSAAFEGRPHHHGSVMEVVRRMPEVSGILQIGVRDLGPPWWRGASKTVTVSAEEARTRPAEELVSLVPEDAACFVSVDIDVLDPSEAPGTGVPVPGGLRLVELEPILTALGLRRRIVGMDLVEVAPDLDRARLTAQCGVRALVRLMDAVQTRRASAGTS